MLFFIHSVVPHHHHAGQVCLDVPFGYTNATSHVHLPEAHSHGCNEHNLPLEEPYHYCSLNQLIIVPDKQVKLQEDYEVISELNFFVTGLAILLDYSNLIPRLIITCIYSPPHSSIIPFPDISSFGLRAPPQSV